MLDLTEIYARAESMDIGIGEACSWLELMADEIERLRADNEWLRSAIKNAVAAQDWNIARAALEQSAPFFCADHPHCPCGEAKMRTCNWPIFRSDKR